MGFAIYINIGPMLRHFAAFRRSLEELRDTGIVALSEDEWSVQPITDLLRRA
jgi:hypothetical protein